MSTEEIKKYLNILTEAAMPKNPVAKAPASAKIYPFYAVEIGWRDELMHSHVIKSAQDLENLIGNLEAGANIPKVEKSIARAFMNKKIKTIDIDEWIICFGKNLKTTNSVARKKWQAGLDY